MNSYFNTIFPNKYLSDESSIIFLLNKTIYCYQKKKAS